MLHHKYLYNLQSWTNLEESIEIQQTWKGLENLNIFFCLFFDCNCQNVISGKETGHLAMYLPKFQILIYPDFLRSYVSGTCEVIQSKGYLN